MVRNAKQKHITFLVLGERLYVCVRGWRRGMAKSKRHPQPHIVFFLFIYRVYVSRLQRKKIQKRKTKKKKPSFSLFLWWIFLFLLVFFLCVAHTFIFCGFSYEMVCFDFLDRQRTTTQTKTKENGVNLLLGSSNKKKNISAIKNHSKLSKTKQKN